MSRIPEQVLKAQKKLRKQTKREAARVAEFKKRHARDLSIREEFLRATVAIQTPPRIYAAWLAVYIEQGGKITHPRGYPHSRPAMSLAEATTGTGLPVDLNVKQYGDTRYRRWMPTTWPEGTRIPAAYGSLALDLMIIEDHLSPHLDLSATTDDRRTGCEFGHTEIYTLKEDSTGPFGMKAGTNSDVVETFPDINDLLLKFASWCALATDGQRAPIGLLGISPPQPD